MTKKTLKVVPSITTTHSSTELAYTQNSSGVNTSKVIDTTSSANTLAQRDSSGHLFSADLATTDLGTIVINKNYLIDNDYAKYTTNIGYHTFSVESSNSNGNIVLKTDGTNDYITMYHKNNGLNKKMLKLHTYSTGSSVTLNSYNAEGVIQNITTLTPGRLTGLNAPTGSTDAVNKLYFDNNIPKINKFSVSNLTLTRTNYSTIKTGLSNFSLDKVIECSMKCKIVVSDGDLSTQHYTDIWLNLPITIVGSFADIQSSLVHPIDIGLSSRVNRFLNLSFRVQFTYSFHTLSWKLANDTAGLNDAYCIFDFGGNFTPRDITSITVESFNLTYYN